ncbi:MAG TPA: hypothetical protein PKK44_13440 [Candidatus Hydrogenedentes bacterium]|nr:hypothetical protein [Candidatus Hydrogenedentota bacterium]
MRCTGWVVGLLAVAMAGTGAAQDVQVTVDPVTRYFHVAYPVPAEAPETLAVACVWAPAGSEAWRPARVMPLMSETAMHLARPEQCEPWLRGEVVERRAAGLTRTVVFNPYPDAQADGRVDALFRLTLRTPEGTVLAEYTAPLQADNTDVVYIEDWAGVFQHGALTPGPEGEPQTNGPRWAWRTDAAPEQEASRGNILIGHSDGGQRLPQLSYPLDLRGPYAVFVRTAPSLGGIALRFTGEDRTQRLASTPVFNEVLWQWRDLEYQHLVLEQLHAYTGPADSSVDYVKFVPLSEEVRAGLDAQFGGETDKLVAGYWEPYSYAFSDVVSDNAWHRAYLTAYAEARVPLVDMQISRLGMKAVYETRASDQLLYTTQGDPIGAVQNPLTDNVGRMQQYTNTLEASLRAARDLGFSLHANFGATNCYPGSPLQGEFSKAHPDWVRGSALRYEVPEVRAYMLSQYREALAIGARGLSIDFCRYPEGPDTLETCNAFMQELRALADAFARPGDRVRILVRFPANGVRRSEIFDYATWARQGWVDYLCPSNIQGRHLHVDMAPYYQAVKGTPCLVLPALDGLSWGQPLPGPFLWRVHQLYREGAPGVYVYQADSRVVSNVYDRRTMRLLPSSADVARWWDEDARVQPRRSKGIYITPLEQIQGYAGWHRIRAWVDGISPGPVEFYLDDVLVHRCEGLPYVLGTEDYESDKIIPPGGHTLRVRAQDGDGWLEERFEILGAP